MDKITNIGFFSAGLDTYWEQFESLKDKLQKNSNRIAGRIGQINQIRIVDAGMVDSPEKALAAASAFNRAEVDLVFLHIATYCLSSTILPVAQRIKCPVIVLNLQPEAKIDYTYINNAEDHGRMTGLWLESCQICSAPEIASIFNRCGIRYDIVTGHIEDPAAWKQIGEWTKAVGVCSGMRNNRLGILGRYYGGMLDVYTDLTRQSSVFGTHMEIIEMCELAALCRETTEIEIETKIDEFRKHFSVSEKCSSEELRRAARTSSALDKLAAKHNLGALAYYYQGAKGNEYTQIVTSLIAGCTLLTGRGIPAAGECEVKNAQAMKILSLLDAGGSFAEFYAMDFEDDVLLLGHDGPAHPAIAEGAVELVPLSVFHGKPGHGLSIQMSVKHGKITLLSLCEGPEGISLLLAEGESTPGPVLRIGNTNSRYRFSSGVRDFTDKWCKAGPSHHCAIGVGHLRSVLEKTAFLFNIQIKAIE